MFILSKKKTWLVCLVFLTGCISSLLKEPAPVFSNEIEFPKGISDFTEQKTSSYPSWKNKKTLNVISVISDCSDSNLTLKSAHSVITNAVENETILEEKKIKYKETSAYYRKISGQIESHTLDIISLSFKFKNCFYVSSLSGSRENLNLDMNTWNTFNQNINFKK